MAGKKITPRDGDNKDLPLDVVLYCKNLSEIANPKGGKPLDRAYMVLTSEFKLDLAEVKKDVYVANLVLHTVLQGETAIIDTLKRGTMKYQIEGKPDMSEPCNVYWCEHIKNEHYRKVQEEKAKKAATSTD